MGLTQEQNLYRKVLLISALCLAGAGASSYYLYLDLMAIGRDGEGDPIAQVTHMEAKVRRKPMGAFTWSNVSEQQPLFRKDSVQTGAGSAAALKLLDGSILELGEQSLIVLDDTNDLSLQFMRGTGVIHGKEGNSKISVSEDGKTRIEKLPIRMVSPEPLAELFTSDATAKPVTFQWVSTDAALPSGESLSLDISSEDTFSKPRTQSIQVTGTTQWETQVPLKPGRYFWRVSRSGEPIAPARTFRLIPARPLVLSWPLAGEKISRWGSGTPIQFRWTTREELSRTVEHHIEISQDAKFSTSVRQEKILPETGMITLSDLSEGRFFWRLVSKYPENTLSSAPERFTIEKRDELAISLLYPGDKASIELRPEVRFNWKTDPIPELEYQWELVQVTAAGKEEPVLNQSGTATGTLWKDFSRGLYRWRVTARLHGQSVGTSPWRSLSIYEGKPIALTQPADRASILYWDTPPEYSFEWEAETGSGSWLLEVASDSGFSSIVKSHSSSAPRVSSKSLSLAPGSYYWRVKQVEGDGSTLKTSRPHSVTVGQRPVLSAPKLDGPEPGEVFNPLQKLDIPILTWNPVPEATGYEVIIYYRDGRAPASTSEKVHQKLTLKGTRLELPDLKQEGDYFWTVRTIDPLNRPGEPAPRKEFRFTYGARLKAPKILAPEVQ